MKLKGQPSEQQFYGTLATALATALATSAWLIKCTFWVHVKVTFRLAPQEPASGLPIINV